MKIKWIGPRHRAVKLKLILETGKIYNVPDDVGKSWIKDGYSESVKTEKKDEKN